MAGGSGIGFMTSDGFTYFVRDEVLEACKLEDEELAGTQQDLKGKGRPVITDSVRISREEMPPLEFSTIASDAEPRAAAAVVAPTVMCCW